MPGQSTPGCRDYVSISLVLEVSEGRAIQPACALRHVQRPAKQRATHSILLSIRPHVTISEISRGLPIIRHIRPDCTGLPQASLLSVQRNIGLVQELRENLAATIVFFSSCASKSVVGSAATKMGVFLGNWPGC